MYMMSNISKPEHEMTSSTRPSKMFKRKKSIEMNRLKNIALDSEEVWMSGVPDKYFVT